MGTQTVIPKAKPGGGRSVRRVFGLPFSASSGMTGIRFVELHAR